MRAQYLDTMDLERERGITIKAQNVRVEWRDHVIHLIDTPGHVDFGYEVAARSRRAKAWCCSWTRARASRPRRSRTATRWALEHDLTIVAVLIIDLPAAEPERRAAELEKVLGLPADETLRISAKTGEGVEAPDAIVERIPAPQGDADAPLQALIFDSYYDAYRGVISAVRGSTAPRSGAPALRAAARHPRRRGGRRAAARASPPSRRSAPVRSATSSPGLKDVGEAKVGETVTDGPARRRAPGLQRPKAHGVLRSLPGRRGRVRGTARGARKAAAQRQLVHVRARDVGCARSVFAAASSACCTWRSPAAARARVRPLARGETVSNVEYRGCLTNGDTEVIDNPSAMPPMPSIEAIEEPFVKIDDAHAHRLHRHVHGARAEPLASCNAWTISVRTAPRSSTTSHSPRS